MFLDACRCLASLPGAVYPFRHHSRLLCCCASSFACKQRRFLHAFECSLDDCLWGDADEGAVRTLALSFEHLGFDSF